jgi:hypothetical protein
MDKKAPHEVVPDIDALFKEGTQIDAAIVEAAREAILAHRREGLPLPIWKDGQTVWVRAEDIELPEEEAQGAEKKH